MNWEGAPWFRFVGQTFYACSRHAVVLTWMSGRKNKQTA